MVVNFLICFSCFRFAPVFSLLKTPAHKVFGSSVSALTLRGLSDVGYPGGSSTVRTRTSLVLMSYGFSVCPEEKDGNAAACDGNP
jgi:hypothetical protein